MATSRTLIETDACPGALLRGDTQWYIPTWLHISNVNQQELNMQILSS